MLNDVKVILIGGSPMSGKSTLAENIASYFKCSCISTDDIGEILQTVSNINPMKGINYKEYYIIKSSEELENETYIYHQTIFPAIKKLINNHIDWGRPIIIEGWALYPSLLKEFKKNIKKIWLISEEELLKERLINNRKFYENASNEKEMIKKYLKRSIWHNKKLLNELKENNEDYILNTRNITEIKLMKKAIDLLEIRANA